MNDPRDTPGAEPGGPDAPPQKKDAQGRIGTVMAGRYKILELLGEGAQGSVYVGEHLKIGRKDAIKVLQPALLEDADAVARFTRGASKASHINHPNVCTVYDFGETEEGLPFMASELVSGEELHDVLKRDAPLELGRAVDLLEQAAAGLHAAHQLNIVHRDLKPANIMITRSRDGREVVKVVDFDIAKGVGETENERGGDLTQAGWIIGTPQYMSPEQITAEELDARSDIYSLALIFYEMITGRLPNDRGNTQKLMWERVSGDLKKLADVRPDARFPEALQHALDRALAKDRENRPATAVEFAREVRGAFESARAEVDANATEALEAGTVALPSLQAEPPEAQPAAGETRVVPSAPPGGEGTRPVERVPATQAAAPPTTAEERGSRKKGPGSRSLGLGTAVAGIAGLGVAGVAVAWGTGMIGSEGPPTLAGLPAALEMEVGDSRGLDARVHGPDGEPDPDAPLTWLSRDPGVARVSADGTVSAASAGSTFILVRSGEVADSVQLTVYTPVDTGTAGPDPQEEGDAGATDEPAAPAPPPTRETPAERNRETAQPPREDAGTVRERMRSLMLVVDEFASRDQLESARDQTRPVIQRADLPAETRALANWLHAQALDLLGEPERVWCPFAREADRLKPGDASYQSYAEGCAGGEPRP